MDRNGKYLVLVPFGPGQQELFRLQDLFDSLSHYQAEQCAGIIVVDDRNHGPDILESVNFPAEVKVIKNPRCGRGWGWEGGLSTGLLAGCHAALEQDFSYVLKLDTDSLVISPFHEKIMQAFESHQSVGMVGSHLQPGRGPKEDIPLTCGKKLVKLLHPVSAWRKPHWHLRFGRTPRMQKIRYYYQSALKNGYLTGEVCEGGGYALRSETIRQFERERMFDDPLFLIGSLTEDVMISMLVKACGFDLFDLSGPGKPFRIQMAGLADDPRKLVVDGCSIVHSLKDYGNWREDESRRFFRERRRASMDQGQLQQEQQLDDFREQRRTG